MLLDEKYQRIRGSTIREPYANDIKEYLRITYGHFRDTLCYAPSSKQIKAVRKISNEIGRYWQEIIDLTPTEGSIQEIKRRAVENCKRRDRKFVELLVHTQMFTVFIESRSI